MHKVREWYWDKKSEKQLLLQRSHCFVGNNTENAGKQLAFLREMPYGSKSPQPRQESPGNNVTEVIAFSSEKEHDSYFKARGRFSKLANELVEVAKSWIAGGVAPSEAKSNAKKVAIELLQAADVKGASSAAKELLLAEGERGDGRGRMASMLSELLSAYARHLDAAGAFDSLFGYGMGSSYKEGYGERDVLELVKTLLAESKSTPRLRKVLEEVERQQISLSEASRPGCGGA